MVGPHKAIVISNPQHRRQSLAALLRSIPDIGEIYECDNTTCQGIDPYFYPSIILCDCWVDDTITLEQIEPLRRHFSNAKCLALVKQNSPTTSTTSADALLVEGFSVDQFFQTVRHLIKNIKTI
jgi:DNA-binding NarL/FixJ family response regulator